MKTYTISTRPYGQVVFPISSVLFVASDYEPETRRDVYYVRIDGIRDNIPIDGVEYKIIKHMMEEL